MKRFEYEMKMLIGDFGIEEMTEMGKEGWELVTVTVTNEEAEGIENCYFKREIEED